MQNKPIQPFVYEGNKTKLIPQLLKRIPKVQNFYDLFGGSGVVGLNMAIKKKAENIFYNEFSAPVFELVKSLFSNQISVNDVIVCKTEKEYYDLRDKYNRGDKIPINLLSLNLHSNSNRIRFNLKSEFNVSFGNRGFNKNRREHLENLTKFLSRKARGGLFDIYEADCLANFYFSNLSFDEVDIKPNSFLYLDPPYLIAQAVYNKIWNSEMEIKLLNFIDKQVEERNIKFALSNVFESSGKSNDILKKWSKKYRVDYLERDYKNASAIKKREDHKTVEVLITNY